VIKALRVVMIIWAALGIFMGLGFIFSQTQLGNVMGFKNMTDAELSLGATLGALMILASAFIITAAVQNPLKHILWVRFATIEAVLDAAVKVYNMIRGFATFSQIGTPLIVDVVFAVALLALYPWRKARSSDQAS
jgi:hypothetical protein